MEVLLIGAVVLIIILSIMLGIVYGNAEKASIQTQVAIESNATHVKQIIELTADLKASEDKWKNHYSAMMVTEEKRIRADANKRSRAVIRGQATEHLTPFICNDYAVKDYRFLGNPIDFLICDGLSGIKDGTTDQINWVVLMDVKTGKAQLSKSERRIRDAVIAGRVKFVTYNPDTKETREWIHEVPDTNEGEPNT